MSEERLSKRKSSWTAVILRYWYWKSQEKTFLFHVEFDGIFFYFIKWNIINISLMKKKVYKFQSTIAGFLVCC